GVLYVLDEPSIGLHARDNRRLLDTLGELRDLGNTIIVVELDEETIRSADYIVDLGPGAGRAGGGLVVAGTLGQVEQAGESLTGKYLSGELRIKTPGVRRKGNGKRLVVKGARHNNLKEIDVEIPLGAFVCVTGVSGSGKSSLVADILVEALRRDLNGGNGQPGAHERIEGLEHLDKMIAIDQSPIGRTPRSNPGTYIKVFDEIRALYAQLPQSKARGYKPGRFSFNVVGGRCEACQGNGATKLEMDFLADIWVTCPVCRGHRFNHETLQVQFKGRSIAQVLEMDIQEALAHFENIPKIHDKLKTLHDVGLDYIKIGQPSPTLSGGEAQRVKLARELVKRSTGRTFYTLDEPTTGLHFADVEMLLKVLHDFVDAGNTVLVVEHNLEVIKTADWVIDLGPEGGAGGGRIVAAGTPEQIAEQPDSYTGQALAAMLSDQHSVAPRTGARRATKRGRRPSKTEPATSIRVRGAGQHNLKRIDVEIPRDRMTVCCGVSGSGKTSLAMDTIYAEGQRRYVESLSAYARQFVGQMQKPKFEHIEGLSPAIAIEQKRPSHSPRSTVGTVTEIYDYLRILFARLGEPHCPDCSVPIGTQSADEVIGKVMAQPEGTELHLMAPIEPRPGQAYETFFEEYRASGYVRLRVDGQTCRIDQLPSIDRRRHHAIEVVVDRVVVRADARSRIADSVENALGLGQGVLRVAHPRAGTPELEWPVDTHSQHFSCDCCGRSFEPLAPHHFSFNSSLGWCPACEGLGTQVGAHPAALLHDAKQSLAEGAIDLWPRVDSRLFQRMLAAFCRATGIPAGVPYDQLGARHRRAIMHGCGDAWFDVPVAGRGAGVSAFRFQYKGLYPALDEAGRLSPRLRGRLEHLVDEVECSECGGSRLRDDAAAVQLRGRSIDEVCRRPLALLLDDFRDWKPDNVEKQIAGELIGEIRNRLEFLVDVGLEYLTLARPTPTLSGGEMQRIRLASQVGSGLCGVLYVLDEPTVGLHPRDNRRLLTALERLRDLGNTLLLVEHDREVIQGADQLLDFGPGAGRSGGQVVAQGTPQQLLRRRGSITGPYLSGKKAIAVPSNRRMPNVLPSPNGQTRAKRRLGDPPGGGWLEVRGARHNNLKNIDVSIPLGTLTVVTGTSGSGKSSLVNDILYTELARMLHRAKGHPGAHDALVGLERINKVIRVDQQPLGQTPTSNAATFTGLFDHIRGLFAQLPEARLRGYSPRRFSFNVPGGRCDACEGNGQRKIEMHFLPDVWVECDTCHGQRYNPETLAVEYHGRSIADILEMSCGEAAVLFRNIPKIRRTLETLCDVGLDYLTLGQAAPTLSGGEAQRVKLAAELSRPDTGQTLYLLDEPTTGLHFEDLRKLLDVLNRLVDLGNTVVVIEHNMDVVKTADWVIDLGPEAGDAGGHLVAAGTPEDVAAHAKRIHHARRKPGDGLHRSYTGEVLEKVLKAGPRQPRVAHDFSKDEETRPGDVDLSEVGHEIKMPWQADGRRWHTADRVARNGGACRWDGRILAEVIDRIEESDQFSPTDWSQRSVVEVRAARKSTGWFFHAITGEEWLLKMKFRTGRGTFDRREVVERLDLKPLNEMPDLPLYGREPRVKCRNLRGPWQEVELRVHGYEEIDRKEFWEFVAAAIAGFGRFTERVSKKPDDLMPWKALGRKWHFLRKGFRPGKTIAWQPEVLERLCEAIEAASPDGQFAWQQKQVVHRNVPGLKTPWVSIQTKKLDAVYLWLYGRHGRFTLGRMRGLGWRSEIVAREEGPDLIGIRFRKPADLKRGDLARFFAEHLAACREAGNEA
ncbi:MAG: excinuclease ABC subunit UvrA, partial [Pirellulales bacterium]|nr:excinuclease ABC subunit UvrA [Pirellulales bacterium]